MSVVNVCSLCFYIRAQIKAQRMTNNVLTVIFECTAELHKSDSQQTLAIIEFALTYSREKTGCCCFFLVRCREVTLT